MMTDYLNFTLLLTQPIFHRETVLNSTLSDYSVQLENLTKEYSTGTNKVLIAVDHICLGIPARETFGLFGLTVLEKLAPSNC